ncbi:MAG TPA: alanyl-tRNA editing protein, partial [Candidatus Sulfotelmatobacter sp.]|nr:alanyl-tRNA editing protein [Candidatus Sulfotelmatobacter sp.]
MASERLYYDDSYTTRFRARIEDRATVGGKPALELAASYFYPESGGQLADRGVIGAARVLDVQAEDDGRVWHLIEGEPGGEECEAELDWARRFDHMQQHTGQHLLSAVFDELFGAATVSVHFGPATSTIDLDTESLTRDRAREAVRRANEVVLENRPVTVA